MSIPNDNTTAGDSSPLSGAEIMRQFLPTSPYVGHLGLRLDDALLDVAKMTLPFTDALVTIGRVVHGGAIASLIDTVAMVAAWSGVAAPTQLRGSTVGMTVAYLAPAEAEDITATAYVLRRGRSLVYLDVEVHGASGALVAKGMVTYKIG